MLPQTELARLHERLERLKKSLMRTGPVAQGSILQRTIRRTDPARPGKMKDYGPYYQWTRKIAGRTAIQNLTAPQAKAYARAIRENRRLEKTVTEMRAVSLKLLALTTPSVAKRRGKRKDAKTLS